MSQENQESRQVYSSQPTLNKKCEKCKEIILQCRCKKDVVINLDKITARLSLEKAGRSGKTVTVISQLPPSTSFLKDLLSDLKKKCGAGGTFDTQDKKGGFIEIQGDHRETLRKILSAKGIKIK